MKEKQKRGEERNRPSIYKVPFQLSRKKNRKKRAKKHNSSSFTCCDSRKINRWKDKPNNQKIRKIGK